MRIMILRFLKIMMMKMMTLMKMRTLMKMIMIQVGFTSLEASERKMIYRIM